MLIYQFNSKIFIDVRHLRRRYDKAAICAKHIRKSFSNYLDLQINLLYIYSGTAPVEKRNQFFEELMEKDSFNLRLISFKAQYSNQFN